MYESLSFFEIKAALANLPYRWNPINPSPPLQNHLPTFMSTGQLQEQQENETLVFEDGELPLWKQPNLLNLKNFTWLMNNEDLCRLDPQSPENTRLLPILVHTARHHFRERLALRSTWGAIPIYKNWDVRFVFLMGEADRGSNPEVNQQQLEEQEKRLKAEQKIFGDLVIGNFVDSYHNLTYKVR